MALPLADGLADHDGGGRAQTEAHHQKQAVQVAHDAVGGQKRHGHGGVAENNGEQAVAQAPKQLIHQHRGGIFHKPAQHFPAGPQQCPKVQGDEPAAKGADQADEELRHAAQQRGQGRTLHAQRGEAAFAEDEQVVQSGVQHRGHSEQLHAEAGVLHTALGTDIDGREHIEHIGEADEAQIRRTQQGQVVLVAHQVHDGHRPREQHHGHDQRQADAQKGGHADDAADAGQILLTPVLADEDAHAGLDAEHDGDEQEHRHVGGGDGGHLVVAQAADHQRVDEAQREGDEVLQRDGRCEGDEIAVERFVALQE